MRFVCNGRVYVAAEMQVFRTQDHSVPTIYLSRDGRVTLVVNQEPDGTLSAHRAGTGEIINLSRRYNIAGLLGAFPASFAPAQILDSDAPDFGTSTPNVETLSSGTQRAGVLA